MKVKQQAYLLCGIYGAAVVYLIYLLSSTQSYSFYSGDAGVKLMAIKQICASEDFRYLADTHAGWVKDVWAQGFFPIHEPFIFPTSKGHLFIFPMGFQFINAIFYKEWGYAGLYIIPVLSILLLWYWFILTLVKLSYRTWEIAVLLFVLAFCSPLSIYGVVYWEHITAMLFMFAGVYYFVCKPQKEWAGLLLGILDGLAAWLRPESMFFNFLLLTAMAALYFNRPKPVHVLFVAGVVVGTGSFLLFNKAEYGFFFGAHGLQVLTAHHYFNEVNQLANIYRANLALVEFFPVTLLLVPILVLWLVYKYPLTHPIISLLMICAAYCAFSMLMFPNDGQIGGKQWGSRYMLPVVTIIPIILSGVYKEWRLLLSLSYKKFFLVLLVLSAAFGFSLNTVIGTTVFRHENLNRVGPALHLAMRDVEDSVIVVNSQYVTMEMGALYDQKAFFLTPDTAAFRRLVPLLKKQGVEYFLYINHGGLPNGFSSVLSAYGTAVADAGSYKVAKFLLTGAGALKLPPDILSQHTNKDR